MYFFVLISSFRFSKANNILVYSEESSLFLSRLWDEVGCDVLRSSTLSSSVIRLRCSLSPTLVALTSHHTYVFVCDCWGQSFGEEMKNKFMQISIKFRKNTKQ